jgi:hypothetical protein
MVASNPTADNRLGIEYRNRPSKLAIKGLKRLRGLPADDKATNVARSGRQSLGRRCIDDDVGTLTDPLGIAWRAARRER